VSSLESYSVAVITLRVSEIEVHECVVRFQFSEQQCRAMGSEVAVGESE
jgi:hypothetical protein